MKMASFCSLSDNAASVIYVISYFYARLQGYVIGDADII